MDFFQCLGVLLAEVALTESLMTKERGSRCSGGEGREATLPGEIEEDTSSDSVRKSLILEPNSK
jgi:hypothetical protein